MEQQIAQTWKKAYWDKFSALLGESPPDLSMLVEILADLRSRLVDLTPHREDLAAEARAKIDLNLIKQMLEHRAFGISELSGVLEYVVGRLRQLEAPADNEATDQWTAAMEAELTQQTESHVWSTTLPAAVFYLSAKIDAISHGAAQSKFDVLSSFVQQHGAEYERQHFAARGQVRNVQAFVSAWAAEQQQVAAAGGSTVVQQQLTPRALLAGMLVKLVQSTTPLLSVQNTLPETLALDVATLQSCQNDLQQVVLCCGWLHACAQVSASAGAKDLGAKALAALKQTIVDGLQQIGEGPGSEAAAPSSPETAVADGTAAEPLTFRRPLDKIVYSIKSQLTIELKKQDVQFGRSQERMMRLLVETMPAETNKLYTLMKQRVVSGLTMLLLEDQEEEEAEGAGSSRGGGSVTQSARDWMKSNNLSLVVSDVEAVAERLRAITDINLKVHAQLYAVLLAGQSSMDISAAAPPAPPARSNSGSDSEDVFRRAAAAADKTGSQ